MLPKVTPGKPTPPYFILTVGTYCAGKSSWSKRFMSHLPYAEKNWVRISAEEIIADIAQKREISVNEIYQSPPLYQEYADTVLEQLQEASRQRKNIIYDSTNAFRNNRANFIGVMDSSIYHYHKIAVYFPISPDVAEQRLEARHIKEAGNIYAQTPTLEKLRTHMAKLAQEGMPTVEEGFDSVISLTESAKLAPRPSLDYILGKSFPSR